MKNSISSTGPVFYNDIRFSQARSHLDPDSLLKDDPADVLIKVNITMNLINHHKYLLTAYRDNVRESCVRQEVTPAEWNFADKLVCARLDAFQNRLKKVKVSRIDFDRYAQEPRP